MGDDNWDVPYRKTLHEALAVLHGHWTVAVLATLALGDRRYSDLRDEINQAEARMGWASHPKPVADKVLLSTLQRARENGLVHRFAEDANQVGSSVWYGLTVSGKTLIASLRPLVSWAQQHREQLTAAPETAD